MSLYTSVVFFDTLLLNVKFEKGMIVSGYYSEAQKKATYKYIKNFDRIEIKLPKGTRDKIRAHAESRGESVTAFVARAISEAMARDENAL